MTASLAPEPVGAADRTLARYVQRTVYPYSAYYRGVLDGAGVGASLRSRADLRRLPATDLASITDPGALVLRPDVRAIVRRGDRALAARIVTAKVVGGMHGINRRVLEHRFKPVHWMLCDGVPLGYSSHDLIRLAKHGQTWLEVAGVGRADVLVSIIPPGPTVAYWETVLGARRAAVPAVHLDSGTDPETIERLAPTVLAGDARDLVGLYGRAAATGTELRSVRTILAVGSPLGADVRGQLREQSGAAAVVGAWAPSGVRALWTECRSGAERQEPTGYHTSADEVLELASGQDGPAAGELLWTGIGWQGSALLRLRTYTTAAVEAGSCPACGRAVPRVVPVAPVRRSVARTAAVAQAQVPPTLELPSVDVSPVVDPAPAAVAAAGVGSGFETALDAEAEVASWQVERRVVAGNEETIVFLAPAWGAAVIPLIRRLDRHVRATQFVVLPGEEIAARVATAGGRRVIDTP